MTGRGVLRVCSGDELSMEGSLPSGEESRASRRVARRCSSSWVARVLVGEVAGGLGGVVSVPRRMAWMNSVTGGEGWWTRERRLWTGIGGAWSGVGRGEHEVGSADGVGVQALEVEVSTVGGLAGGRSRRKLRIRSWVDSTGLNCSGVQVGEVRFRSFREREEEGFFGFGELGVGRLLVVMGDGDLGGDVAWELAGDGDLALAFLSLMCALE